MKIWCVEDDESVRDMEIYTLQSTGFTARGFGDGRSLFQALKQSQPDLLILDIMLPDLDGVEILKQLRQSYDTQDLPIIMATAKGMEYDKIQSLDLGADDYLVKPFGMMEMVSKIRAVLRRCRRESTTDVYQVKGLRLDTAQYTLTIDDTPVDLTHKEFEMLRLFLAHPGRAFNRDQLFELVWGDVYMGESRTVDVHIRTLRRKLGNYAKIIKTVRNIGYRLELPES